MDLPLGLDDDHLGAAGALCGSGTGIVGRTGRRVVLVRDGSQTVRLARGSARLEPQRRMRVSDRFRIASLTKTYTATVVVQLAGEGKLALDDPVERWLPGVVPNGAAITLRMLLNHHSGLFDYFNDPQTTAPYLAGDFGHVWTPQQLVAKGVVRQT